MRFLGFKPTKNSGSGWVEKEDGYNDEILCQLKSTDAESIKINLLDLKRLEYNASVSHKSSLFVIQFLNSGEIWLLAKPEEFKDIADNLSFKGYKISGVDEKTLSAVSIGDFKEYASVHGVPDDWSPPDSVKKSSGRKRVKVYNETKEKYKKQERKAT